MPIPQANHHAVTPRTRRWRGLCSAVFLALALHVPLGAAPFISEFLANNDTGHADEDGERNDWIEICNPGPEPISLDGYFLTDDVSQLDQWRLPDVTLEFGECLLVFASGKDRAVAGAQLHANFSLSENGEFLALVGPDALTILSQFSPEFPEQLPDVSYGSTTVGAVPEGYFETPTPGAPNGAAKDWAGRVHFSRGSRTLTESLRVHITPTNPQATIRYTIDGSMPHGASPIFTSSIRVTETMHVRARAYAPNAIDGPVRSEFFLRLDAGAAAQTSNLPIVVLDTFGGSVPSTSSTDRQEVVMAIFEPKGEVNARAALTNLPDLVTRGGVRKRGSSSGSFPKYAMSFEAWTEHDWEERSIRPAGLPGEDDWILNSRYEADRTLMRNALAYELSRQAGRYAARTRFVEVYLKTDEGGNLSNDDYFGVYCLMERLDRDDDRIDVSRLDASINSEPEITGGYIFKNDRADPGEPTFQTNAFGRPLVHIYPDGAPNPRRPDAYFITTAQKNWLRDHVNEIWAAVSRRGSPATDGINPDTGKHFSEYIDVDSFIDHHWINTLMMNVDYGSHSALFHLDRGGKLQGGPVWDFDRSSGATIDHISSFDISNPRQWDPPPVPQTWYNRRCQWYGMVLGFWNEWENPSNTTSTRPDYLQRAIDRWFELRAGPFSTENVHTVIDAMADELREAQARNFARWSSRPPGSGQGFEFAEPGLSGYEKEVSHLKGWLQAHIDWADTEFLAPPQFVHPGGTVAAGFQVELTTEEGVILYTTDGSDPRAPGGVKSPSARRGLPGPLNETTEVTARVQTATGWSAPVSAVFVVGADLADDTNLAITEILYRPPILSAQEIAAGFDDRDLFEFLELTNIGPNAVDLRDVALTDGVLFEFSNAPITVLQPDERVLLVSNRAAFELRHGPALSGIIAGEFADDTRLSNDGERLRVEGAGGTTIRDFTFNDVPPWPEAADGAGYSLVLVAPERNPDHGDPFNWRASTTTGGNAGGSDSVSFAGDPDADEDRDGLTAFLEHALGSDDTDLASGPGSLTAAVETLEIGLAPPADYLVLSYRRNLGADDVEFHPEVSSDLVTWDTGEGFVEFLGEEHQADGTSIVFYRSATPRSDSGPLQFLRLRVVGR